VKFRYEYRKASAQYRDIGLQIIGIGSIGHIKWIRRWSVPSPTSPIRKNGELMSSVVLWRKDEHEPQQCEDPGITVATPSEFGNQLKIRCYRS